MPIQNSNKIDIIGITGNSAKSHGDSINEYERKNSKKNLEVKLSKNLKLK